MYVLESGEIAEVHTWMYSPQAAGTSLLIKVYRMVHAAKFRNEKHNQRYMLGICSRYQRFYVDEGLPSSPRLLVVFNRCFVLVSVGFMDRSVFYK